jgi:anti-anti-sigma factor
MTADVAQLTPQVSSRVHGAVTVIALTGVTFLDCACLRAIFRSGRQISSRGGSFALAGPPPSALRILQTLDLISCFEIYATAADAIVFGAKRLAVAV